MRKDDFDIPEVFRRAMEEAGWQMNQGGDNGGEDPPPPRRPMPPAGPSARPNRSIIIIAILLAVIFSLSSLATFYTDWLWFEQLGYENVFVTRLTVRVLVFAGALLLGGLILIGNWLLARRRAIRESSPLEPQPLKNNFFRWVILILGGFLTLFFASAAAAQWENILLFINAESFGRADPIFNRDIGFYIFQLPIFEFVQGWFVSILLLTLLGIIPIYAVKNFSAIRLGNWRPFQSASFRRHFAVLASLLLIVWASGYLIDTLRLVFSPRGVAFGASYVDMNITIWVLRLQIVFMLLTALALLYNVFRLNLRLPIITGALWLAVFIIGGILPGIIQRYLVEPNEITLETPYIDHNIEFTRAAFALDKIETREFGAVNPLSPEDILDNEETLANIRLWDYRPLRQTFKQLQALRPYYEFNDVDIDRYMLDGEQRQVMLSARELDKNQLPAPSWVNRNLEFTHGYGIVMNPVNEVTREGQPNFFIKDLPPQSRVDIEVTRPEIYFGELTNDAVYVGSGREEFSYPSGDDNIYTTYQGNGGIMLDSFLKRLAFAVRQSDPNVLLTSDITDTTRIQYRRQIQERIRELTPFLVLDKDPYLVVNDEGYLVWMQDAYTVSNNYPYSTPVNFVVGSNVATSNQTTFSRPVNYMRNPVKVVLDAYHGEVDFYISDPDDPIIRSYAKAFPGLFQPLDDMPSDLKEHIRYPVDYFNIQAQQNLTYHMTNTRVFYNKEDLWQIPSETFQGVTAPMEPYYVTLPLPSGTESEYLLILPITPANRNNMIAWIAARNDPENYGQIIVYELPRQELVFGPTQVAGRINQEPTIAQQFSLWDQRGSQVIRGNLLVLPMGQSFLYIQPIYLLSETNALPELKRIVTASNNSVAMDETLGRSLVMLSGNSVSTLPPISEIEGETDETLDGEETMPPITGSIEELVQMANAHYLAAEQAQRDGDWARYGQELAALEQVLGQLVFLTSTTEP